MSNDIMDRLTEQAIEADGGVRCPACPGAESARPIIYTSATQRELIGFCPVPSHGSFSIDVSEDYDALAYDAHQDAQDQGYAGPTP